MRSLILFLTLALTPVVAQVRTPPTPTCPVVGATVLDVGSQGEWQCGSDNHWVYVPIHSLLFTQVGQPNGVAGLGTDGKIKLSEIDAAALSALIGSNGLIKVASLPASPTTGMEMLVGDAASATSCAIGSGAYIVGCRWSGSQWDAIQISGGSSSGGSSILSGSGVPSSGIGNNGDLYIQNPGTTSVKLFGPKASGSWGTGVALVGPQGVQGIQGIQGPQGAPGSGGSYSSIAQDGAGNVAVTGGASGSALAVTSSKSTDTTFSVNNQNASSGGIHNFDFFIGLGLFGYHDTTAGKFPFIYFNDKDGAPALDVIGGLLGDTSGLSRPSCSSDNRGELWPEHNGSGTLDTVDACLKQTDESYSWTPLNGAGGGGTTGNATSVNSIPYTGTPQNTQVMAYNGTNHDFEPTYMSPTMASQLMDFVPTFNSTAHSVSINPLASPQTPSIVQVRSNEFLRQSTPASATISSGGASETAYVYVDDDPSNPGNAAVIVGTNTVVTACTNCRSVTGITAYPATSKPLFRWGITSGQFDSAIQFDDRAFLSSAGSASTAPSYSSIIQNGDGTVNIVPNSGNDNSLEVISIQGASNLTITPNNVGPGSSQGHRISHYSGQGEYGEYDRSADRLYRAYSYVEGIDKRLGGLKLDPGPFTAPTCDASHRFTMWAFPGAAGAADHLQVCAQDATGTPVWVQVF